MRHKLSEKHGTEREALCCKIVNIIDLNDDYTFLLCDLDNDVEKQTQIMALKDDIKAIFACSTISTFKSNYECKRPYLNIIRSILRKQGYTVTSQNHWKKISDGTFQRTMKFKIDPPKRE